MKLVDEAESLLLYQFKDAKRLKNLMRSLVMPLETIANDIETFSDGLHIDEASGHLLDVVGKVIGQPRACMGDEDFRIWLKLRIKLNRCNGTPEELLSILHLLLGSYHPMIVAEHKPNNIILTFFKISKISTATIFSLIKKASPPGLRLYFINATAAQPFRFDISTFSQSRFADFFKEDIHHERI